MDTIKQFYNALSRKERIAFIGASLVMLISVLTYGIRALVIRTSSSPTVGGEYSEGFVGQPVQINPILASSDIDRGLVRLTFSNLASLAESVESSKDFKKWNIRLKEGVLWSDGEKLTSDDVVFTIEKTQDPTARSPLAQSWQGISVQRLSELEVQFSAATSYALFPDNLQSLYVMPKHLWKDVPVANWRLSDYNLKPVGSGPYEFDRLEKEDTGFITEYRLKINEKLKIKENWEENGPYIANISFRFFPDGRSALNAFNKGTTDGLSGADYSLLPEIKRSYRVHDYSMPSYYALFINQSQSVPLKDVAVRKALAASIKRESILNGIFGEYARVSNGPIPRENDQAQTNNPELEISEVEKILDNEGWTIGENGVREKKIKDGSIKLEFSITVPEIPFLTKTADELKNTWQEIGAAVNVNVVPIGETMSEVIKNRDYQTFLFGNILHLSYDLYPFWHSKERFSPGLNLSLYSNKEVDLILEEAAKEPDGAKRIEKLGEAENKIIEDAPAIFLYSPDFLFLTSKELKGVETEIIGEPADRFLDASSWYIKTTRSTR